MIDASERQIVGQWLEQHGRVVADEACRRIYELVRGGLQLLGAADGGWSQLYRDPDDGRLWELTYPNSSWHGGGPPTLQHLNPEVAHAKYGHAV